MNVDTFGTSDSARLLQKRDYLPEKPLIGLGQQKMHKFGAYPTKNAREWRRSGTVAVKEQFSQGTWLHDTRHIWEEI